MITARIISEADIIPNRAAGYRLVKGELKNQEWVSPTLNTTADGALYLTVYDMAKWDAALYTERLLKKSSLEQMWTPIKLNNGRTQNYGFGWFLNEVPGHHIIEHSGSWQGFKAFIARYVDNKLTVVLFVNWRKVTRQKSRMASRQSTILTLRRRLQELKTKSRPSMQFSKNTSI